MQSWPTAGAAYPPEGSGATGHTPWQRLPQRGGWLLLLNLLYGLAALLALAASLVSVTLGSEASLSIVLFGLLSLLLFLLVNIMILLTDGPRFWSLGGEAGWTARGWGRRLLTGALYLLLVVMPLIYLRQAMRDYPDADNATQWRALLQI